MDAPDYDLEPLLAAQVEATPAVDLRSGGGGGVFFRLKDLRAEARAAERDAVSAPDAVAPVIQAGLRQWTELAELATDVLQGHAKDLEIACWLCEAWVRLGSFGGLNRGLELLQRLVDLYWEDGLQPRDDEEDGVMARVAPIGALLGLEGVAALLQPIRLLPLSDHAPDVALWTVETAFAPLQGGDDAAARERMQARRAEQVEHVRQALIRASDGFLRTVHGQAKEAADRVEALSAALDERASAGRFGSQVVQPLRAVATLIEDHAGSRLADAELAADEAADPDAPEGAASAAAAAPGRIASRAEAYDAILRIADFFAEAEPQSLVARSLREVVRRGRLPLEDLLGELLPDAAQRTLFLQRAGVRDETSADTQSNY